MRMILKQGAPIAPQPIPIDSQEKGLTTRPPRPTSPTPTKN